MELKVDFATRKDLEGIVNVYKGWQEFKGVLPDELIGGSSYEGLLKYFDGSDNSRKYIVGKVDGKIVGACYMELSFLSLKSLRLGYMFVSGEFRGKSVASAMVDKIVEYARQGEVKKIWLWTQEELVDAIRLYEGKGFVLEGRQMKQFCGKDALVYGLVLE